MYARFDIYPAVPTRHGYDFVEELEAECFVVVATPSAEPGNRPKPSGEIIADFVYKDHAEIFVMAMTGGDIGDSDQDHG